MAGEHLKPLRKAVPRPMAFWFTIMILGVVAAVACGNFFYYYVDLRRQNTENREASLRMVRRYGVEVFEAPIMLNDGAALEAKAKTFLEEPFITRVQIYNDKGVVLKTVSKPDADDVPTTIERVEVYRDNLEDDFGPGRVGTDENRPEKLRGIIEFHVSQSVFNDNQNKVLFRLLATAVTTIIIAILTMLIPALRLRRSVDAVVSALNLLKERKYSERVDQRCEISDFQPIVDNVNELAQSVASHERKAEQSIAQLQLANDELKISEQRTRDAEESVRRFIRIGSHELRNPVNGLIGLIELLSADLQQRGLRDSKVVDRCDTSLRLLAEMHSTLERLFDLSKMSSGSEQLAIEPFHFSELVQYVRMVHADGAAQKRIAFAVREENEIPKQLIGDIFKIRHLIGNLVQNAIKFTRAGFVEVVFYTKPVDVDHIILCCKVIDSGSGIEQVDLPNIFGEFFTRTPGIEKFGHTYSGWGLGLTFVKRMVELMGGIVSVKSEVGKGTTFSVEIPLDCVRTFSLTAVAPGAKEPYVALPTRIRILVVDDDEVNAETISERLRHLGAEVDTCLNAMWAKANVLKGEKYDMAILDYRMPGYLNGAVLASELRKIDPAIYIVGLTGDKSDEVRRAWAQIVDRMEFKPVNTVQLQNIVDAYRLSKTTKLWNGQS